MDEYLHGAYGHLDESVVADVVTSETVPVYFGTAPTGLVRGYDTLNEPVKISSLADAKAKIGYSDDFAGFTLCEAVAAHFDNGSEGVGPIYVVNVFDAARHKAKAKASKQVTVANGRGYVSTTTAVLDTVAVTKTTGEGEQAQTSTLKEGKDYTLDYDYARKSIVLSAVDGGALADGAVTVAYDEMDPSAVTAADVIGTVTADGQYSGIAALPLLYQEQFVVPNLLSAPGWSHEKDVYKALIAASQSINGHWDAFVAVDLPLVGEDNSLVDTIDKAVAWKDANGYDSERCVACWPMATDVDGRRFHLSTLFCVGSQRVDQSHDGIPFETPSNKAVSVTKQFFGDNSKNRGFDQQTANKLNEHGIVTVIGWAGEWLLWGPHTAAYEFGNPSIDPRSIFSTNMRMLMHITNSFQLQWGDEVDQPMTRGLRDRIVNVEQEKLDRLVNLGALIGDPRVYFLEVENPTSNLMNGDFRWDLSTTPTPPMKSASAYVAYTDEGFSAYFEGGAE